MKAVAEERRQTEGILKKDEVREFEIEDGQIINFGKARSCEFYIPLKELDKEQFALFNRDGNIYLVDKSTEYPTRIRVSPGKSYRLNQEDFFRVGLEQDMYV